MIPLASKMEIIWTNWYKAIPLLASKTEMQNGISFAQMKIWYFFVGVSPELVGRKSFLIESNVAKLNLTPCFETNNLRGRSTNIWANWVSGKIWFFKEIFRWTKYQILLEIQSPCFWGNVCSEGIGFWFWFLVFGIWIKMENEQVEIKPEAICFTWDSYEIHMMKCLTHMYKMYDTDLCQMIS